MYPPEDLNAAQPILVSSRGCLKDISKGFDTCTLDPHREYCLRCGRTIEEIIERGKETKSTRRSRTT